MTREEITQYHIQKAEKDFPFVKKERLSRLLPYGLVYYDDYVKTTAEIKEGDKIIENRRRIKNLLAEIDEPLFKVAHPRFKEELTIECDYIKKEILSLLRKLLEGEGTEIIEQGNGRPSEYFTNLELCRNITNYGVFFRNISPEDFSKNDMLYFIGLLLAARGFYTEQEFEKKFTSYRNYRVYLINQVKTFIKNQKKGELFKSGELPYFIKNYEWGEKSKITINEIWGNIL